MAALAAGSGLAVGSTSVGTRVRVASTASVAAGWAASDGDAVLATAPPALAPRPSSGPAGARGREPREQDGEQGDAHERDQGELPKAAFDPQPRHVDSEAAVVEDEGRGADDGPAARPLHAVGPDGFGDRAVRPAPGRDLEGRARGVVRHETESTLLVGRQLGGRGDRRTAVLARGRGRAPGPVVRQQVRADAIGCGDEGRDGRSGRDRFDHCLRRIARGSDDPIRAGAGNAKIPATTYFPERLPSQYLRRWRA